MFANREQTLFAMRILILLTLLAATASAQEFETTFMLRHDADAGEIVVSRFPVSWSFEKAAIVMRADGGDRPDLYVEAPVVRTSENESEADRSLTYTVRTETSPTPTPIYTLVERWGERVVGLCARPNDRRGWYGGCRESVFFSTFEPRSLSEVLFFGEGAGTSGHWEADDVPEDRYWDESDEPPSSSEPLEEGGLSPRTQWLYLGGERYLATFEQEALVYTSGPGDGCYEASGCPKAVSVLLADISGDVWIGLVSRGVGLDKSPLRHEGNARLYLSGGDAILLVDRGERGGAYVEGEGEYAFAFFRLTPREITRLKRERLVSVELPGRSGSRHYPVLADAEEVLGQMAWALSR